MQLVYIKGENIHASIQLCESFKLYKRPSFVQRINFPVVYPGPDAKEMQKHKYKLKKQLPVFNRHGDISGKLGPIVWN